MPSRAGLRHLPDDSRTFSCPYEETWGALHLVPCSTSVRRRKKRLELGLNHESGPVGAPVRWALDASPMGVIGPLLAPSNSRSDGLLCLMRADAAQCTILAEADDDPLPDWPVEGGVVVWLPGLPAGPHGLARCKQRGHFSTAFGSSWPGTRAPRRTPSPEGPLGCIDARPGVSLPNLSELPCEERR